MLLDRDLAKVYGVDTERLNQQRTRNPEKFPEDFAFQLTNNETDDLRLHFASAISAMSRVNPWAYILEGCNMAATRNWDYQAPQIHTRNFAGEKKKRVGQIVSPPVKRLSI